jgi:hypothetical protein
MQIFKTRSFEWWQMGLIKVCLISLGILLGLYFYDYLLEFLWLWWGLFVIIGIYFIVRFFRGQ